MRRIACLLITAIVLSCCSGTAFSDWFIPSGEAVDNVYDFSFQMADSLSTYDFSFYTRVDGTWDSSIRLDAVWHSPDGGQFSETVYLRPESKNEGIQSYRSGVQPSVPGDWRLTVLVPDAPEGFLGLGLICEGNGTR